MIKEKAPIISIRDSADVQIGVLYGYFNDSIEMFLEGKVGVLTLSVLDENNYRSLLSEGNSLSFTYRETDFHMTIVKKEEDENLITITAWSLVLELNNETKASYDGKSMTFAQYVNAFDGEKILTLNVNEVSDKKISYKWESQQTMLERLFSLATVFDAEIEFNSVLNDDGSLKQMEINAYKAHDENNQGLGKNRSNEVFYFGEDITTVKKTSDIMNLYTAIRAKGKDGLSLSGYKMNDVVDEDGNTLYYLKNGMIYAPQSREQFPSNLINKNDGWTVYDWETEYSTQASLAGNALTKLKELCIPAVTWTIEGYIKADIGDTISVHDSGYSPTLLLIARINSQKLCMTNPSTCETTFSNVKQIQSEVSQDLIARMNELIEANKKYEYQIVTNNGTTFKNGEGQTTLTAKVLDGVKDITDTFNLRWTKDGNSVGINKSITINASDVSSKAIYRFDVLDEEGLSKGGYEVTIVNVNDGVGIPGKQGADGKTPILHTAYAFSDDGKKWFSNQYPRPNLFKDSHVYKTGKLGKIGLLEYLSTGLWADWFVIDTELKKMLKPSTTYSIQYTFELLTKTANTTAFTQSAHGTLLLYKDGNTPYIQLGGVANNVPDANTWVVGTKRTRKATFTTPADLTGWRILAYTYRSMNGTTFVRLERGKFFDIKIEESGNSLSDNTTGIVANSDDSEYYSKPTFTGTYADYTLEDSTNPDDYTWVPNRSDSRMHVAYSNSEDKTDIVTAWPRPNIYPLTHGLFAVMSNDATNYPVTAQDITENGILFRRVKRTEITKNPSVLSLYNSIGIDPSKYAGKRLAISYIGRADKSYPMTIMSYAQNSSTGATTANYDHYHYTTIGTEWSTFTTIWQSWPSDCNILRFLAYQPTGANAASTYLDFAHFKIEILEPGQEPTPYYPYGKEVAFKYIGTYSDTLLESSTDPTKYGWNPWKGEQGPAKYMWVAYADDGNGKNLSFTSEGKLYMGIAENKDSSTPSKIASDYKWSAMTDSKGLTQIQTDIARIPTITTSANPPVEPKPKNGDGWWVMSGNKITEYRIYGDGEWHSQEIDQSVLNIRELNAVDITGSTITGATMNGSVITSTFDRRMIEGSDVAWVRGTSKMSDGRVLITSEQYEKATGKIISTSTDYFEAGGVKGSTRNEALGRYTNYDVGGGGAASADNDGSIRYGSAGIVGIDNTTMMKVNFPKEALIDTSWVSIGGNTSLHWRVTGGVLYIRFDGWAWNKTGQMGSIPIKYIPQIGHFFMVSCNNTNGTQDNFQLQKEGGLFRLTNRCGTNGFKQIVTIGPIY
ncbi:hypothetical protein ACYSNW_01305 [Enterococcus sp. LJL99]